VDTTPVDRAFGLSAGVHELTLKNPAFRTETRKVLIEPGRTQKLVLELTRAKGRSR
jgi:hypothetical protein